MEVMGNVKSIMFMSFLVLNNISFWCGLCIE